MMRNKKKQKVLEYLEKVATSRKCVLPKNILDPNDDDDNNNSKNANQDVRDHEQRFVDLMKHAIVVRCMLIGIKL